jgi:hypothetical protein
MRVCVYVKRIKRNFDMLLLDHRFLYRSFSGWSLSHFQNAQRARKRREPGRSIQPQKRETDTGGTIGQEPFFQGLCLGKQKSESTS